jgi:hypothetical protein
LIDQESNVPDTVQQEEENLVDTVLASVISETIDSQEPAEEDEQYQSLIVESTYENESQSEPQTMPALGQPLRSSSNFVERTPQSDSEQEAQNQATEVTSEPATTRTRARRRTQAEMALLRADTIQQETVQQLSTIMDLV